MSLHFLSDFQEGGSQYTTTESYVKKKKKWDKNSINWSWWFQKKLFRNELFHTQISIAYLQGWGVLMLADITFSGCLEIATILVLPNITVVYSFTQCIFNGGIFQRESVPLS